MREPDWDPVHLGNEALLDDEATDIPRTIRAPTEADEWSAVRLVNNSAGYKELRHGFHDFREGWRVVRLVLR